jgi:hypothetical protein
MGRIVRIAALGLAVLAGAAQAVPFGRDHDNPPVRREPAWDHPDTRALARRACFDCHSNEVRWPWYSWVAPVSWLVARDVAEAREALNFSEWDRPQKEAREGAREVREGAMPLPLYALAHPGARLTPGEREALARGLERTPPPPAGRRGREGRPRETRAAPPAGPRLLAVLTGPSAGGPAGPR